MMYPDHDESTDHVISVRRDSYRLADLEEVVVVQGKRWTPNAALSRTEFARPTAVQRHYF
jgi:hypothetical protein